MVLVLTAVYFCDSDRNRIKEERHIYCSRTNRLSLGPQPFPVPFRAGSAYLCRSQRPREAPMQCAVPISPVKCMVFRIVIVSPGWRAWHIALFGV